MARNSGPRACSGPGGTFIVQDPYVLSSEHTPLTSADVREGWQASMRSQPSARHDVDQYYLRARARGAGSPFIRAGWLRPKRTVRAERAVVPGLSP